MMRLSAAVVLRAAIVGSLLLASASGLRAEDAYPTKPIRIVVPYPPGAVTDSVSRLVAAELGKVIGQTVLVENRPGGGTVIGTQAVKQAPADGYHLLYQSNALITNMVALKQPGYELSDFDLVGTLSSSRSARHVVTPSASCCGKRPASAAAVNASRARTADAV